GPVRASTGRRFAADRSVNGNGTSSRSPRSNIVPDLVLAIVLSEGGGYSSAGPGSYWMVVLAFELVKQHAGPIYAGAHPDIGSVLPWKILKRSTTDITLL